MTALTVVPIDARNPGPMTGAGNHTYLIPDGDGGAVLVDAGVGQEAHLAALDDRLHERGARLTSVVVTHAHPDHAGGAVAIAGRHPEASFWKFPWPSRDRRFDVPWRPLAEGQAIPLGAGDRAIVLHTPGHSPDHVVLWHERSRTMFTGDLVESGKSVMIHATGGGSLVQYLASLQRIRALAPRVLYPAHGPVPGDPDAVIAGHIAHRLERERQVLAALGGGWTGVRDIAQTIYDRFSDLPSAVQAAASETVLAHLQKLRDEGRAEQNGDLWTRSSTTST